MRKRFRYLMMTIVLMLIVSLLPNPSFAGSDDLTGRTLESEMRAMVDLGILHGYEDGTFRPGDLVTRGQFAAFIARALDLPAGHHTFKDVPPSSSLSEEIGAVYKAGIMSGYSSDVFNQTQLITREQAARTLKNVLVYSGLKLEVGQMAFVDVKEFSSPVGLQAAYHIVYYSITEGIPVEGGVKFAPAAHATREQAAAFIYRFLTAYEKETAPPPPPPPTEPELPEPELTGYTLGYVENGTLVKQTYRHATYASALQSFMGSTADALYKEGEVIGIKKGVAFGINRTSTGAKAVTTVYKDPAFTKQATYVEHGRELQFIEATEGYVKVQAGGTVGYVKHREVELLPLALVTNRDYYTVSQWGTLIHYIYNYSSKTRGSYAIGPAPASLAQGATYYSTDGVHFYTAAGQLAGQHYPYFQYQSVRTKTSYTAEQLDAYIMDALAAVSTSYPEATTKSKLIGMGKHFKAIEAEHNVNALFMLAAAIHEGAYGMSVNSQTKNNMFGIKVFDSTPEAGEAYAKPEESIQAFVREYMNKKYATPFGAYANGAAPGNKTSGFNVAYASDPTWGSKIAGHMTRIDNALGKKDYGKYQLAMTNYTGTINVRSQPVVSSDTLLFTYKARDLGVNGAFGYPLTIIGSVKGSDGYTWYKVFADLNEGGEGWIREDLVRLIN